MRRIAALAGALVFVALGPLGLARADTLVTIDTSGNYQLASGGADAVILEAPSYTHLVYRPGVPLVGAVVMAGEVVLLELSDL